MDLRINSLEEIYLNNILIDKNDFISNDKVLDASIISCGKYGITTEEYYNIADKLLRLNIENCPYYLEYGGVEYQGQYEFSDGCLFSQVLDRYDCNCFSNEQCWFRRQNANKEILDIIEKYNNWSKIGKPEKNENLWYQSPQVIKDGLIEQIKTIEETLQIL